MKTQNATTTRPAAKLSGQPPKKVDWAFRRLRHQAAVFLARGDATLRRDLMALLQEPKTWTGVEETVLKLYGRRQGQTLWRQFMDRFFGHQINRRAI